MATSTVIALSSELNQNDIPIILENDGTDNPHLLNHIHNFIKIKEQPATCTNGGYITSECKCGEFETKVLEMEQHKYIIDTTISATCQKKGKIVYRCEVCDARKTVPIEKIEHTFIQKDVVAPTCTKEGKIIYECECGEIIEEVTNKTEHNYVYHSKIDSTTTVKGKEIYKCSYCEKEISNELPLKKSAMETDMCGESLLNKPLPHGEYYEVVKQLFDRISLKPTMKESLDLGIIAYPDNDAMKTFWDWWNDTYKYASYLYWYTSYNFNDPEREDGLLIWGDDKIFAEETAVYTEVYRILDELKIDNTVTQKEAIKRINDYLCENRYYQYDAEKRDGSLYNSIFGDSGVCHNYALAFQVLCLGAGIECHYYSSDTMNHAWNKVYFSDGTSYWVDVCWNDAQYRLSDGRVVETSVKNGIPQKTVEKLRSCYLLITTEELLKDHTL